MYKVLIADDEVLVRVGLKTTIDWEANGFTVVAEASNGEQAYEQYKKHLPDVIITDIKMPKKDGLWLIEEVRRENGDVRILVLTCYDEFSYARKALKSGADDYILKSEVEDEELVAVMQSVKKKIDALNRTKQIQTKELSNINDIKRSIYTDMVKSDFKPDGNMAERCGSIEFPVADSRFAFACIAISDNLREVKLEDSPLKQTNTAVLNIIHDILAEGSIEYIYSQQASRYILFLSSPTLNMSDLKGAFASMGNAVKQYFDCSLNIIYTDIFSTMAKASEVYKNFSAKSQILFYKNEASGFMSNVDGISFTEINASNLKKEHNSRFIEAIGQEDISSIRELICEICSYFGQNNVNPMTVKIFFLSLMADIFSSYGLFLENSKEINNHEYYHYQIDNSEYLEDIRALLTDFTGRLINEIWRMRQSNPKVLINQALNYIHCHYDEKLSLEDVAQKLHLSKHYLCSVFKKATGENMSLYINKLRIEKAKKLLLESDGRVKEIFEEVGYANQQYFSKVFKKITGMTVIEYKESLIPRK